MSTLWWRAATSLAAARAVSTAGTGPSCPRQSSRLARLILGRRIGALSDPLSGFFAVRRFVVRLRDLDTVGYKILLELLVRCDVDRVLEVPVVFQRRLSGRPSR